MNLRSGLKLIPVVGALVAPLAFDEVRASGNEAISNVISGVVADYQRHFADNSDKAHFEKNNRDILERSAGESMEKGFYYHAALTYLQISDRAKAQLAYEKFVEDFEAQELKSNTNYGYLKEAYVFLDQTEKIPEIDLKLKQEAAWEAFKRDDFDRAITLYSELGEQDRVKEVKAQKAERLHRDLDSYAAAELYEEIGMMEEARSVYKTTAHQHLYDESYARDCFAKAGLTQEEADTILSKYESKQKAEIAAMRREAKADVPAQKLRELAAERTETRWKAEALVRAEASLVKGDLENASFDYRSAGWTASEAKEIIDPLKREKADYLATKNSPEDKYNAAGLYASIGELERSKELYREAARSFSQQGDELRAAEAFQKGGDQVSAAEIYRAKGTQALLQKDCSHALSNFSYALELYPPFIGGLTASLRSSAECAAEQTFTDDGWRGEIYIKSVLKQGGYSEKEIAQWQGAHWLGTDPYRSLSYYKEAKDCPGIVSAALGAYEDDMSSCLNHEGFWDVSECASSTRNLNTFKEIADCL